MRIGIGIGRPEDRDPNVVARYVLSNFEREEESLLKEQVFPKVLERLSAGEPAPDTT